MVKKKGPGKPKFWNDTAQRSAAAKLRTKHPSWSNERLKAFLEGKAEAEKDAEWKKFQELQKESPVDKRGQVNNDETQLDASMSLSEYIEKHRSPTGFISPLDDIAWINKYLSHQLLGGGRLYKTQEEISIHFDKNLWAAADVWRGVGKTMLALGKIVRRMCDNPNIRLALITEESSRSIQRVAVIKVILQTNRLIIKDYGYLPHDKAYAGFRGKWSSKMLQLKRTIVAQEPTLMGVSQGATDMLGYHFDGILIDDPWSTEIQRIKGAKEKWMNWFTETFLGCIEKGAFCWMLFTRKGVDDLYSDIIYTRGLFVPFTKPAIKRYPPPDQFEYILNERGMPVIGRDGVPTIKWLGEDHGEINDACHGRFSMSYLLGKKRQQGNLKFEQEFQCNPMPLKGALLDWDLLRFYGTKAANTELQEFELPNYELMTYISFMDQAFGLTDRADFTVVAVIGMYGGRFYLDRLYRGKWTESEKIAMINKIFEDFPRMTRMGIESGFIQTHTAKKLIQACSKFPLVPIDQRGAGRQYKLGIGSKKNIDAKILRIYDQFSPHLVVRDLYVNKSMPFIDELEKEFRFLGNAEHDDIMDAVGSALEMVASSSLFKFIMSGTSDFSRYTDVSL